MKLEYVLYLKKSLHMTDSWKLLPLPLQIDVESKKILKKLPNAHRALAELKGLASTIPNAQILLNTLILQEAKDSSEVENIITTHDELFKAELQLKTVKAFATKEVQNYVAALKRGFQLIDQHKILTANHIKEIQEVLEKNKAGFRKVPGTTLKNPATNEVVYTPPQDGAEIEELMSNLEKYINTPSLTDKDPLVKMAILHFQFESIHPFYDGNGRTGRIINILYLVLQDLLDIPILYLSRYIIQNKSNYYAGLQNIRTSNHWEEWILFIIEGIELTARQTIQTILQIKALMQEYKQRIRRDYKFYSQDLLNNLFQHPYTKIEFLQKDLNISRITAANYLNQLTEDGLLVKSKLGKSNYYINQPLFDLFIHLPTLR